MLRSALVKRGDLATVAGLLVLVGAVAWGAGPGSSDRMSEQPRAEAVSTGSSESETPVRTTSRTADRPGTDDDRVDYHPAVLRIVTNFTKADATVNDLPYPEYVEPGDEPGMVLPAGGPYKVKVTYNGNTKVYTIGLDPYEVRYLIVELSGYEGGATTASSKPNRSGGNNKAGNKGEDGKGRVTVYSKPKGNIRVDGTNRNQKTPATINVDPGEHDVRVKFDDGKQSEAKTVRVREGSRIKLFFRQNN